MFFRRLPDEAQPADDADEVQLIEVRAGNSTDEIDLDVLTQLGHRRQPGENHGSHSGVLS